MKNLLWSLASLVMLVLTVSLAHALPSPLNLCGQFSDDRILKAAGPSSQVLYAVAMGATTTHTTANGYTFQPWNNNTDTNIYFAGNAFTGYLGGGGTTGDTVFNTILNSGVYGNSNNTDGFLKLTGLTVGNTYRALLLFSDTRSASNGNVCTVGATGTNSASYVYAYSGGTTAIGSYVMIDFVAGYTYQYIYITNGGTNQLNALVVSNVNYSSLTPTVYAPTLNANESVVGLATPQQFGALGDGVHNDSPAFTAAINSITALGQRAGGVLYVPKANYVFKDPIQVQPGVTIHGDWTDWTTGSGGCVGTTFMVETTDPTTPFLTMASTSAVIGLNFWYPTQSATSFQAYPYTISAGNDAHLRNIVLVNSYNGILGFGSGRVMETIIGTPLNLGYWSEFSAQYNQTSDLRFSAATWPASKLAGAPAVGASYATTMYDNATGVLIGRSDGESFTSCTISGFLTGFQSEYYTGSAGNGPFGGALHNCIISNCKTGFLPDSMNVHVGLCISNCTISGLVAVGRTSGETAGFQMLFDNCTLTSESGLSATAINLAGETSSTSQMQMENCTVNGQIVQTAGCLPMVNCKLNTATGIPQITMNSGTIRTSLTGCTFSPSQDIQNSSGSASNLIINSIVATTGTPPTFAWSTITTRKQTCKPAKSTLFVATTGYGAVGDGVHDDTADIQSALTAAGNNGGGIVYLPAGHYLTSSSLNIPSGVELRGVWETGHLMGFNRFDKMAKNSVIWVTGGQGTTTPATVGVQANAGIVGVDFDYINQIASSTPLVYPATIQGKGANIYVIGVTIPNAYSFADFDSIACANHFLDDGFIFAYTKCFKLGGNSSGMVVNSLMCDEPWAEMSDSPSASSFNSANERPGEDQLATVAWLGDCNEKLVNLMSLGDRYHLFATNETPGGVPTGPIVQVFGAGADNCTTDFHFDGTATNTSVLLTDCFWIISNVGDPTESANMDIIESEPGFAGNVRFYAMGAECGQATCHDFLLNGGSIGVEGWYGAEVSPLGSTINNTCFQLSNYCGGGSVTGSAAYPITFSGTGVYGKMSEFINCRYNNGGGFDYVNEDPTSEGVRAASDYDPNTTTILSDTPVYPGLYGFKNLNDGFGLDNGGSLTSGTNVGQWTYDASTNINQQWLLSFNSALGTYKLSCVKSGDYLDSLSNTTSGSNVGQYTSTASTNQQWYLTSYGSGDYRLVNATNGMALDTNGSTTLSAPMLFEPESSSTTQIWQMLPLEVAREGTLSLQNQANSLVMDNLNTTTEGAPIGQWTAVGSIAQQWQITYQIDGYYTLTCVMSNQSLDDSGHTTAGSDMVQWATNKSIRQEWSFSPVLASPGYYQIVSHDNGMAIDTLGSTTTGTSLGFEPATGGTTQQWQIVAP